MVIVKQIEFLVKVSWSRAKVSCSAGSINGVLSYIHPRIIMLKKLSTQFL